MFHMILSLLGTCLFFVTYFRTSFTQTYDATVHNCVGIKNRLENFMCDTALSNSKKGREIMERSIELVKKEYLSLKQECVDITNLYAAKTAELTQDLQETLESISSIHVYDLVKERYYDQLLNADTLLHKLQDEK